MKLKCMNLCGACPCSLLPTCTSLYSSMRLPSPRIQPHQPAGRCLNPPSLTTSGAAPEGLPSSMAHHFQRANFTSSFRPQLPPGDCHLGLVPGRRPSLLQSDRLQNVPPQTPRCTSCLMTETFMHQPSEVVKKQAELF